MIVKHILSFTSNFCMAKILIVDDSTDLLQIFHWMLQKKGYDCVTTYYKEGLFVKLEKLTPSLVILDVNLHGEDGRNICKQIKENPQTKDIPVILCSGDHELLKDYKACKADDFLEKPFDTNTVVQKIEAIINSQPVASSD